MIFFPFQWPFPLIARPPATCSVRIAKEKGSGSALTNSGRHKAQHLLIA